MISALASHIKETFFPYDGQTLSFGNNPVRLDSHQYTLLFIKA